MALNLYGYTGFDYNKALNDWDLAFGTYQGFNEEKGTHSVKILITRDKRVYSEITTKNGNKFTPDSNDFETIRIILDQKPVGINKGNPVKVVGVKDAFIAGADSYNPQVVIMARSLELLRNAQSNSKQLNSAH